MFRVVVRTIGDFPYMGADYEFPGFESFEGAVAFIDVGYRSGFIKKCKGDNGLVAFAIFPNSIESIKIYDMEGSNG